MTQRLIDANAFILSIPDFDLPEDTIDACTLRIYLMKCPTVDAVPVTRCKDCKYWWKENGLCTHSRHCDSNLCIHECKADDFCSDGEKKRGGLNHG